MSVSLEKKVEMVNVVLAKRKVPAAFKLQVKTAIDISGSMTGMFDSGAVQKLVDRLLAVAVRFDDNQSIESYAFGSGAVQLSDIKPEMFGSYVDSVFLPEATQSGHLWSGTSYDRALRLIMKDGAGAGGFFGFGKKKKPEPTYLLFVTDGDTANEAESEKLLADFEQQNTYVQLIGIGHGSEFRFLNRMADKYDHVGFVTFPNLDRVTDEQMYDQLLSDELATWIGAR